MLNLFAAVVLDQLSSLEEARNNTLDLTDFQRFGELWAKHDPYGKLEVSAVCVCASVHTCLRA